VMYMPLMSFGVSEHPLPEIRLSPNPTRGYVSLRFSAGCRQPVVLEIVDLYGKVLEVQALEPGNSGTLDLDMGHLPSGMYFVRLYFDNQMIVKKIVKL